MRGIARKSQPKWSTNYNRGCPLSQHLRLKHVRLCSNFHRLSGAGGFESRRNRCPQHVNPSISCPWQGHLPRILDRLKCLDPSHLWSPPFPANMLRLRNTVVLVGVLVLPSIHATPLQTRQQLEWSNDLCGQFAFAAGSSTIIPATMECAWFTYAFLSIFPDGICAEAGLVFPSIMPTPQLARLSSLSLVPRR